MSEAVISVHFSDPLLQGAMQEAARSGLSIDDWLRKIAADRVRDAYLTEKYFSRKARAGDAAELMAILDKAPDGPPMPGDELDD
jgi:hypothetical protein